METEETDELLTFSQLANGTSVEDWLTWRELLFRVSGAVFCGVVICLTLIGNVLVVMAVATFRNLRTITNMLMTSLAVADITVAVFVMPYLLVYDITREWCFGPVFCHVWISCDVMCCTASILHLCIIALDRYWAITSPLLYKAIMNKRRAIILITGAWVASASISFIPIMLGWYSDEPVSFQKEMTDCNLTVNQVYAVVSSLTSFYLPSPIMCYIYLRIFFIARRQSREIKRLERTLELVPKNEQKRIKKQSKRFSSDTKAIKTLGVIMGVFCICWLPFFLMYLILPFCPSCDIPYEAKSAITWLGYINSSINPCIYGLFNADFRAAFRRTLHCDCRKGRLRQMSGQGLNRSLRSVDSMELDSISTIKSSHTF